MMLQAEEGQARFLRVGRGQVIGMQIADHGFGPDFQQAAQMFRHGPEKTECFKVLQIAHMLADESVLATGEAERVFQFRTRRQHAAARVTREFQRPRHETPGATEKMERGKTGGGLLGQRNGTRSSPGSPALLSFQRTRGDGTVRFRHGNGGCPGMWIYLCVRLCGKGQQSFCGAL